MHNQFEKVPDDDRVALVPELIRKPAKKRRRFWRDQDEDHGPIFWSRRVGDPKVDIKAEFQATKRAKRA